MNDATYKSNNQIDKENKSNIIKKDEKSINNAEVRKKVHQKKNGKVHKNKSNSKEDCLMENKPIDK